MKWNYRVFRDGDGEFGIREVFYAESDGRILGCTADTQKPYGKTLEEFAQAVSWFQKALTLPVLSMADIPKDSGDFVDQFYELDEWEGFDPNIFAQSSQASE